MGRTLEWRGLLNEPYCSMGCQLMAAREGRQAAASGATGDCAVCGKTVVASTAAHRATIIPWEGRRLFVCADDTESGKALVAVAITCCKCGADLD